MKQVYLTTRHGLLDDLAVFSSRQKAIAHFNRLHSTASYKREGDITTVSVDGSTVGWITKKIVQ